MSRQPFRAVHRRRPAPAQWTARVLSAVFMLALAVLLPSHGPARSAASARPAPRPAAVAGIEHAPAAALPAVAAAPAPAVRPSAAAPATTHVTLHWGDTLWGLARIYHTTVGTLQNLNALGHSTLIYAGHTLLVPAVPAVSANATAVPTATHPASAPAPATSGGAATAVAFAERQLGAPYLWGGTGDGGYDCSGLVQAAWHAAGVSLPRTTYDQVDAGIRITRDQLHPGDLVFSNGLGHVQLYIGHGTVIQAPHTGATVQYSPLPPPYQVDAYVHVA